MSLIARWFTILSLSLWGAQALAHNVVSATYIEGEWIEGEVGFSNGEMALPGAEIEVMVDGQPAGKTEILDEGIFRWKIGTAAEHRFRANLGAGHVAEMIVPLEEILEYGSGLTAPAGQVVRTSPPSDSAPRAAIAATVPGVESVQQLVKQSVSQAVAKQLKPVRKELKQLRDKSDLRDILGGTGFIVGLFGLLYGLAARKKLKQVQA